MAEPLRHIRPDAFVPGQATPGMRREEALSRPGLWSGVVHTEPGMTSGWHHHGDHDTIAYVVSGRFRADFGPGGRDTVDAQPGDFVFIPGRAIHRESNPAEQPGLTLLVRVGSGEVVVNVDGPEDG